MRIPNALRRLTGARVLALLFAALLLALCFLNMGTVVHQVSGVAQALLAGEPAAQAFGTLSLAAYQEAFFGRVAFIEGNGLLHLLLGQREMNERYRLDNGYLDEAVEWFDLSDRIHTVGMMADMLQAQDIPLLYVQAPAKRAPGENLLPGGVIDHTNDNADRFLQGLEALGIQTLDLRETIREDGLDHYSLFFKTDHHWTPEAGFWAFQRIARVMEDRFSFHVDARVRDRSQYRTESHPAIFLGTHGKRTGRLFAGLDDMQLIIPKFDTWIHKEIVSGNGRVIEGKFPKVAFLRRNLTDAYYTANPYAAYSAQPNVIFTNPGAAEQKRILLLYDSFSQVTIPYFYLSFSAVEIVDVRNYTDRSIQQIVQDARPDLVVLAYYPGTLLDYRAFRVL